MSREIIYTSGIHVWDAHIAYARALLVWFCTGLKHILNPHCRLSQAAPHVAASPLAHRYVQPLQGFKRSKSSPWGGHTITHIVGKQMNFCLKHLKFKCICVPLMLWIFAIASSRQLDHRIPGFWSYPWLSFFCLQHCSSTSSQDSPGLFWNGSRMRDLC